MKKICFKFTWLLILFLSGTSAVYAQVPILFEDHFDYVDGSGGVETTPSSWYGDLGSAKFEGDILNVKGWRASRDVYKGNRCLRFGSTTDVKFSIKSPVINNPGKIQVMFRAGLWNISTEKSKVCVIFRDSVKPQINYFELEKGKYKNFEFEFKSDQSTCSIGFEAERNSRFFLDDVVVTGDLRSKTVITQDVSESVVREGYEEEFAFPQANLMVDNEKIEGKIRYISSDSSKIYFDDKQQLWRFISPGDVDVTLSFEGDDNFRPSKLVHHIKYTAAPVVRLFSELPKQTPQSIVRLYKIPAYILYHNTEEVYLRSTGKTPKGYKVIPNNTSFDGNYCVLSGLATIEKDEADNILLRLKEGRCSTQLTSQTVKPIQVEPTNLSNYLYDWVELSKRTVDASIAESLTLGNHFVSDITNPYIGSVVSVRGIVLPGTDNSFVIHPTNPSEIIYHFDDATDIIQPSKDMVASVKLTRTLKANTWNTVCFPFSLTEEQTQRYLGQNTNIQSLKDFSNHTFNFEQVHQIQAGKAYLIKPEIPIENPLFPEVTIQPENLILYQEEGAHFIGNLSPYQLNSDGTEWFLSSNKLYRPSEGSGKIKGMRGYFFISEQKPVTVSVANDELTQNDESLHIDTDRVDNHSKWTIRIDGQRYQLNDNSWNSLPTGIYIYEDKKIIVR